MYRGASLPLTPNLLIPLMGEPSGKHNLPLQNSALFFECWHNFAAGTTLSLDSPKPF
jgi:hypothetical protein